MSNYERLMDELSRQGRLVPIDAVLNARAIQRMNDEMQMVRREYRRREAESIRLARTIILTD